MAKSPKTEGAAKRPRTRKAVAPEAALPTPAGGKIGALVVLMQRPEGASLADLMAASGWQAHSVRGAISGAIKRKLGLKVLSEKTEAGRLYRIAQKAARP
jgi:hypothetical protein